MTTLAAPIFSSGSVQWDLANCAMKWSNEVFGIFEFDPRSTRPSIDAFRTWKHPDDLPATSAANLGALNKDRREFRYAARIFREDGFVRSISAEGEASCTSTGMPLVLEASISPLSQWQPPFANEALDDASDGALMLGIRAKLPQAHAELFRRYGSLVGRVANEVMRSGAQAEDVVQDVFERLLRKPSQFDVQRGSLGTYLAVKARSRSRDVIRSTENRRAREVRQAEIFVNSTSAEEEVLGRLSSDRIRALLSRLPELERQALELAFLKGLTYRNVGEKLGIAEGTAKGRIRRGLRTLALHLERDPLLR